MSAPGAATPEQAREVERLAHVIAERGGLAAFTGAGASVESGIPDFRSDAGIWRKWNPAEYATIDAFRRDPIRVWGFLRELEALVAGKLPNPGHDALASLERLGALRGIATQNVDGLHQAAGSREVIELHGSGRRLVCLGCGASYPVGDDARLRSALGDPPRCKACGRVLKPDVILFGEPLPADALDRALQMAERAPVLLVVGTSAEVYPAASIPEAARDAGHLVVEMNLAPTVLTQDVAEMSLFGKAGTLLPLLAERVRALSEAGRR